MSSSTSPPDTNATHISSRTPYTSLCHLDALDSLTTLNMLARIATRFPITAALAGKRVVPHAIRHNSSSTTSRAARVIEIAAQAERPSTSRTNVCLTHRNSANGLIGGAEAAVPVMWTVCGVLTYTAWNRMTERNAGENVEKLLIV